MLLSGSVIQGKLPFLKALPGNLLHPARGPGVRGRAYRWDFCMIHLARTWTAPPGFRELQVNCDHPGPQVRMTKGTVGAAAPNCDPVPHLRGPGPTVRWGSGKPWHDPGSRRLWAGTVPPSPGGLLTWCVGPKWHAVAGGFPLLLFWDLFLILITSPPTPRPAAP